MPLTLLRDPTVRLADRPTARPGPDQVVVRMAWAAVCRTDLLVADGEIAVDTPRVLGHEGSGVIQSGPDTGARVVLRPLAPCGRCRACGAGDGGRCPSARQLGVDEDGCFAEELVVARTRVLPVSGALSLRDAVMVEPLAAAMGVLTAIEEVGSSLSAPVLVPGDDRFAVLVRRTLSAAGRAWSADPNDSSCLIGVDTLPLAVMVGSLAPGGTLLLRARAPKVDLPLTRVVQKGLRLVGCPHAPLERAQAWLAEGRIDVADLLDAPVPLGVEALDAARGNPRKALIRIGGQA